MVRSITYLTTEQSEQFEYRYLAGVNFNASNCRTTFTHRAFDGVLRFEQRANLFVVYVVVVDQQS